MKRTMIIVMMLCMLAAMPLMAKSRTTPVLQAGGFIDYGDSLGNGTLTDAYASLSSYSLGFALRWQPNDWMSIEIPLSFATGSDSFTIGIKPSVNLNIPASRKFDIALGVALGSEWTMGSGIFRLNGVDLMTPMDMLLEHRLLYRVAFTYELDWYMSFSAFILMPAGRFSEFNPAPDFNSTKIGLVLFADLL